MLCHRKALGSHCCYGTSTAIRAHTSRVRAASSFQQTSAGLQTTSGADYEALKGIKVVSAADGFEVDVLSLWQVRGLILDPQDVFHCAWHSACRLHLACLASQDNVVAQSVNLASSGCSRVSAVINRDC
jgi:hypothetical protein